MAFLRHTDEVIGVYVTTAALLNSTHHLMP